MPRGLTSVGHGFNEMCHEKTPSLREAKNQKGRSEIKGKMD
jgi:hypothetical protein